MGAFFEGVPDVDLESAWDMVVKADQERDLDDFRTVRIGLECQRLAQSPLIKLVAGH